MYSAAIRDGSFNHLFRVHLQHSVSLLLIHLHGSALTIIGEVWQSQLEIPDTMTVSVLVSLRIFPRLIPLDAVLLNVGERSKGQVVQTTDYFTIGPPPEPPVEEAPPPTASGSFQKRRGSIESQHKFDCPTGHTYCWTGERQEYACMDTSSDVTGMSSLPLPTYLY